MWMRCMKIYGDVESTNGQELLLYEQLCSTEYM